MLGGTAAIIGALDQLRLRLLDLTGRNRLLNFKPTPGKALQFAPAADIEATFQRLVATPAARLLHLKPIFARIEQWTMTKDKIEAMDILNQYEIPCGPILSMKEIAEDASLRASGTVVEVDHPVRGKYLTVGNPIKMSDSPTEVTRSPLLGEHTVEVLEQLGYTQAQIKALRDERVI